MTSGNTQETISQITCYALPYGGIGFLSHVLTYYSIICIGLGVRPLMPWLSVKHKLADLIMAVISLITCYVLTIVTMARCHKEWQFLLLAMWKFLLTCTINTMGIHRCILVRDDEKHNKSKTPFFWLLVYLICIILGLVGLISLVSESWNYQPVRAVTGAFLGIAVGFGVIAAIATPKRGHTETYHPREPEGMQWVLSLVGLGSNDYGYDVRRHEYTAWGCLPAARAVIPSILAFVGFFAALYSDWALGVMTGNLVGAPSSNIRVLYWIYFVAKRLPLLFQ